MDWQHTLQSIRQFSLPATRRLRKELDEVRSEHAQVSDELREVREQTTRTHDDDLRRISDLRLQLDHLTIDRDHAREQARLLEESLREASRRQERTEQRMQAVESQLEDARHQHESNLYLSRDVLQRMQADQKGLLSLQSEMSQGFQQVSHEMLQLIQSQQRPRAPWQLGLVACLLFLSGALATALVLHDNRAGLPQLGGISQGVSELRQLMQEHFRTHDELLEKLTQVISRLPSAATPDEAAPAPGMLEQHGDAGAVLPRTQRQVIADLALIGLLADDVDVSADFADQALQRFRLLYNQSGSDTLAAAGVLHDVASMARSDAGRYSIRVPVAAAIRLASLRTGVDFSYLMELASIESNFDPEARAKTSDASGLYQFRDESWLDALALYGDRYGLEALVAQIEFRDAANGIHEPYIADTRSRQAALDLRLDPVYAALFTAELVRDSRERLAESLEREPDRTDLYLTHFFGTRGAISFLHALAENPDQIAGEIFPGPARRNRNIFNKRGKQPRTVAEVYQLLGRKFNTDRFDES